MTTTLEKKVRVAADGQVHIDFTAPEAWAGSEIRVVFIPEPGKWPRPAEGQESAPTDIPLLRLWGSCKGDDTLDAYFARHHAENAWELAQEARQREESKKWQHSS
jgi:hypothetical protein